MSQDPGTMANGQAPVPVLAPGPDCTDDERALGQHVPGLHPDPAPAAAPGPEVVHSGIYTLYMTPDGGRHLTYRPDGAPEDIHVPDIPPAAVGLVDNFLTHGLPPQVVGLLSGKLSPGRLLSVARQAAAMAGFSDEQAADDGQAADGEH